MKRVSVQYILISITFLCTIFGLFIFHIIAGDKNQSIIENRVLAQRPDLTIQRFVSGEYSKRFESYYNDQFPERDLFIETNASINKNIFQKNVVDDVYVVDNGYLLSQVVKKDQKDAKEVAAKINDFSKKMAEVNINVYTAIMPNKSTMMESSFPSYFPSYGQRNLNLLLKELAPVSNPIDSREAIAKHMDEANMFYYTDHHWQAKAAFFAYQNVMSYIIQNEKMAEKVYEFNDYDWKLKGKPFYGSDARKTTSTYANKMDHILVASLKDPMEPFVMKWETRSMEGLYNNYYLNLDDDYTNRYITYLGGDHAQLSVTNPNKSDGEKILIVKDSYANAIVQFFVPHYKEVHVIDLRKYKGISLEEYVKQNDIDSVILLNNINSIMTTPALTNFR